jgi:anti-sigma28 factor (negative regulator of flagellin synthesis)
MEKIIKFRAWILLFCFFVNCYTKDPSYSIWYYKSKDSETYLNLNAFHKENQDERCYSTFKVNDSIFEEDKLKDLKLKVNPGNFIINAGAVGKDWINAEVLNVKKGDSLVIQFYLKDTHETSNHGPH